MSTFIRVAEIVGYLLLGGIPLGLAVWHIADKVRFRRTDAAELHRLSGGAR